MSGTAPVESNAKAPGSVATSDLLILRPHWGGVYFGGRTMQPTARVYMLEQQSDALNMVGDDTNRSGEHHAQQRERSYSFAGGLSRNIAAWNRAISIFRPSVCVTGIPEAWSALQEAVIKGDGDAEALAERCVLAGNSDLKRQQALAEIYKEGPLPDTMRDLLAPFLAAGGVDGAAGPDAEPPAAGEPAPAAATFAQSALPQAEVEEASAPAAAQVLLSPLNSSAHYPSSPFFSQSFPTHRNLPFPLC